MLDGLTNDSRGNIIVAALDHMSVRNDGVSLPHANGVPGFGERHDGLSLGKYP